MGIVIGTESEAGSVHALWDGRDHVDLNIFLHDDSESVVKDLLDDFTAKSGMNMGLRDDFPRGTGRVMNFKDDLSYGGTESIRDFQPYVDLGDDDDDDEDED